MTDTRIICTTVEIKNPKRDRRSRDWNKLSVIPAGSRFIVNQHSITSATQRYTFENTVSELGQMIVTNSTTVEPESVKELKSVYGCDFDGDTILAAMIKVGKISAKDFADVGKLPDDYF